MNSLKKIVRINLLLLLIYSNSYSVTPDEKERIPGAVTIQSPEVGAMLNLASPNINLYKGLLSVNVPIYNIKLKSLNIPISLRNLATGIRPNKQPGQVGANWYLEAGGCVRVDVKGCAETNPEYHPMDNYDDYLYRYFSPTSGTIVKPYTDFTKDQYSFSFNGYSGKIYIDLNNHIYCSNPELKVSFANGAITNENAEEDTGFLIGNGRYIIKITAKDGTMYFFGGNYIDYMKNPEDVDLQPIAWHLYKIITPNNEHVNFDYIKNESTNSNVIIGMNEYFTRFPNPSSTPIQKSDFSTILDGSLYKVISTPALTAAGYSAAIDQAWFKHADTQISLSDHHLFLIPNDGVTCQTRSPLDSRISYCTLKTIKTTYETIEFNHTNSHFYNIEPLGSSFFTSTEEDRGLLPALGEIVIYDTEKYPNLYFKKFKLEYNTFALKSVQEFDSNGNFLNPYIFDYYYPDQAGDLIKTTSSIDHWGFYNAMDDRVGNDHCSLLPVIQNSFLHREPIDIVINGTPKANEDTTIRNGLIKTYLLAGTLKKITYPTKGFREFEFEQNDFGAMVSRTMVTGQFNQVESLNTEKISAGGIRIKKIKEETGEGNQTITEYKYVKDYLKQSQAGQNIYLRNNEKQSSGIVSSCVNYYMRFLHGTYHCDFIGSSKSNMDDDYIGYSEVAEITNNSIVTIYKFTDFQTNPDKNPSETASFSTIPNSTRTELLTYYISDLANVVLKQQPNETREQERGKLLNSRKFKLNQGQYSIIENKDIEYKYNLPESDQDFDMEVVEAYITPLLLEYHDQQLGVYKEIRTEDWSTGYQYKAGNDKEVRMDEEGTPYEVLKYLHASFIMLSKKKYVLADYLKSMETIQTYGSNSTNEFTENVIQYFYSRESLPTGQEKYYNGDYTDGADIVYAGDGISAETPSENEWRTKMVNKHVIGVPFINKNFKMIPNKGRFNLSESKIEFEKTNILGFPLPSKTVEFLTLDGKIGTKEPFLHFDSYSSNGNLTSYHKTNDISHTLVWSNEKTIGGDVYADDFNLQNSLTNIFANGNYEVLNYHPDGYWYLNSYYYTLPNQQPNNFGKFVIPTLFKTSSQPAKFVFSIDYQFFHQDGAYQAPEWFSIKFGFSNQLLSQQNGSSSNTYIPSDMIYLPDSITVFCNSTVRWAKIEKELTITDNNYCGKLLFMFVTFKNRALDYPANRISLDNLKIAREDVVDTSNDNNGRYLLAEVENAEPDDITYSISDGDEIKLNNITVNTPNALVTTYAYKPLFGMTSQTDPNGKTTYYEYDSFGRLQYVKDDQGKILKKYDYHYSNQ